LLRRWQLHTEREDISSGGVARGRIIVINSPVRLVSHSVEILLWELYLGEVENGKLNVDRGTVGTLGRDYLTETIQ
jgi:hypothetical protein